jgi:hypothetical protein
MRKVHCLRPDHNVKEQIKQKIETYIKEFNENKLFNKNLIIHCEYEKYLYKYYKLKEILYNNLPEYVSKNKQREIIVLKNFDENFSVKKKYFNNIIVFKTLDNEIVNKCFIVFTGDNTKNLSENSYLFY